MCTTGLVGAPCPRCDNVGAQAPASEPGAGAPTAGSRRGRRGKLQGSRGERGLTAGRVCQLVETVNEANIFSIISSFFHLASTVPAGVSQNRLRLRWNLVPFPLVLL